MRLAVSQFATTSNTQENLATCIRMISETAQCKPSIIILPEFCNSEPSYHDHNQAWHEALTLDSNFLQAIAEQAKKYKCYIAINVTLRRDLTREHQDANMKSNISITSCLFSSQGELVLQENKLNLTIVERQFFVSASELEDSRVEVFDADFAKLGLLAGDDATDYKKSRKLALNNAQLLCHSMHSWSLDQGNIHLPSRAFENNVFIASANKIASTAEGSSVKQQESAQDSFLAIGKSQIISPQGKVLAKITNDQEGFVYADVDIHLSGIENKSRPDGTMLKQQLRPELYRKLLLDIEKIKLIEQTNKIPVTANVAIFATYKSNEQAIEDVCHYIENNLSDIIQLPELFFLSDKKTSQDINQRTQLANLSEQVITKVASVLRPFQYVCTSLIIEDKHQAVIISEHGLLASQQQLHFCQRYQWSPLSDELVIIALPLEQGTLKLAMLTADDAHIGEMLAITSLAGIQLLLVPFDIQQPWEVEHNLLAHAAENRICLVAASREKDFTEQLLNEQLTINSDNNPFSKNKIKVQKSTGLIVNLNADDARLTNWRKPKFSGYINQPLVKLQYGKITKAVIHPIAAHKKDMF